MAPGEQRPVKAPLVVGLGNPLAGDDGVGWHVARRLRDDPRLPDGTDVRTGDDLLRLADAIRDSASVVLVDAILESGEAGRVHVLPVDTLDDHGGSAHQLPPAQAVRLLRQTDPRLRDVPVVMVAVSVPEVRVREGLSAPLQARVPAIVDAVIDLLQAPGTPATPTLSQGCNL